MTQMIERLKRVFFGIKIHESIRLCGNQIDGRVLC